MMTELVQVTKCGTALIEFERRAELLKALEFESRPYVDPATRPKRNLVIADIQLRSSISAAPRGEAKIAMTIVDSATGKTLGTRETTLGRDDWADPLEVIAKKISRRHLQAERRLRGDPRCAAERAASPPTPARAPSTRRCAPGETTGPRKPVWRASGLAAMGRRHVRHEHLGMPDHRLRDPDDRLVGDDPRRRQCQLQVSGRVTATTRPPGRWTATQPVRATPTRRRSPAARPAAAEHRAGPFLVPYAGGAQPCRAASARAATASSTAVRSPSRPRASSDDPPLPRRRARAILAIVNAAAEAYRGVIPADRWHEPYMPRERARRRDRRRRRVLGLRGRRRAGRRHGHPARARRRPDPPRLRRARQPAARHRRRAARAPRRAPPTRPHARRHLGRRRVGDPLLPAPRLRAGLAASGRPSCCATYWTIPERQIETSVVLAGRGREVDPHAL